jgi:hypothetical protein
MRARWLAGLALAGALTTAHLTPAAAQQAPAATSVPRTFFPNMGAPLGFNPFGFRPFGGTFLPNMGVPLGFRGFNGQPFLGGLQAPVSTGLSPATTTMVAPDIAQPQSGLANPAAGVPFGSVPAGVAGDTSFSAFPTSIGTTVATPNGQIPIVPGDPRSSLSAGFNSSVTNPSLSSGFNPAVASPFLPNAALPQSSGLNPTVTAPGVVAEQQALAAAQRVMSNTPLTEGIVTSVGPSGAQVQVTNNGRATVMSVPLGQVFFFTPGGQMFTAGTGQITPGTSVLVPMTTGQTR